MNPWRVGAQMRPLANLLLILLQSWSFAVFVAFVRFFWSVQLILIQISSTPHLIDCQKLIDGLDQFCLEEEHRLSLLRLALSHRQVTSKIAFVKPVLTHPVVIRTI